MSQDNFTLAQQYQAELETQGYAFGNNDCERLKHNVHRKSFNTDHVYSCEDCKVYWLVDSSG
jgi:hypothetical protein